MIYVIGDWEYVHYLSGKQLQCLITFNFPCLASPHSRNRDLALENLLSRRCEEIYYLLYSIFLEFLGSTEHSVLEKTTYSKTTRHWALINDDF